MGKMVLVLMVLQAAAWAEEGMLLHVTFEKGTAATFAAGNPEAKGGQGAALVDGKYGKAVRLAPGSPLAYDAEKNLDKRRGTVCMWIRPTWAGNEYRNHGLFRDDLPFKTGENGFYLWHWCVGTLRFDVRDQGDNYLTSDIKGWKAGEWHHIAATWDCKEGTRLFADGMLLTTKNFSYEPKPATKITVGSNLDGADPGLADIDDVRIYNYPLTAAQIRRVMSGRELETVEYRGLKVPAEVTVGVPFECGLEVGVARPLTGPYRIAFFLDGLKIGDARLDTAKSGMEAGVIRVGGLKVTVPEWLYFGAGKHTLSARIAGTVEKGPENATTTITVRVARRTTSARYELAPDGAVLRNGRPLLRRGGDCGLLLEGVFYAADEAGMAKARELVKSGRITDAVRCRLVDEVDCTRKDHGFEENAPTTVAELAPGRKFRLVGKAEEVKDARKRHGREMKLLPAFSYRLRVMPRPTPQLLVVESVNDVERNLEVAVNAARDSALARHLEGAGIGARDLIHLGVTYTGGEYETDGKVYRSVFMIFPKSDAIRVMITGAAGARGIDAKPAAVSRMAVYEPVDSLGEMSNPLCLPEGYPQRTVGLFYPHVALMFDRYGFPNAGKETRARTVRLFMDYCRFLGFNLFEFRGFYLSEKTTFKCKEFEQASDLDIFDEFVPAAQSEGIAVVPRVMYMHCYWRLFEGDDENFQQGADGKIRKFGREGPIPDPLRPNVQGVVKRSFRAMLERARPFDNVIGVSFDTSIGGLYFDHPMRPTTQAEVGYSKWDVTAFSKETGIGRELASMDHGARYEWLRENAWDEWIGWRCKRWHKFMCELRELVKGYGKDKLFVLRVRIMPQQEWAEQGTPLDRICRECGYDPALFRDERGIRMDWFIRVNADRYFRRPYWKPWFYDPAQPGLYRTAEPRSMEIYFNYWELPRHPFGFRVGPGSPAGRAFFEPFTYAMRVMNPCSLTFFNWFRGTIGHEFDAREFVRAFRALPAVEPKEFDGKLEADPPSERLMVKWFGDRLGVVNDSPAGRKVKLVAPVRGDVKEVFDAAMNVPIPAKVGDGHAEFALQLRPYDFRTVVFR